MMFFVETQYFASRTRILKLILNVTIRSKRQNIDPRQRYGEIVNATGRSETQSIASLHKILFIFYINNRVLWKNAAACIFQLLAFFSSENNGINQHLLFI